MKFSRFFLAICSLFVCFYVVINTPMHYFGAFYHFQNSCFAEMSVIMDSAQNNFILFGFDTFKKIAESPTINRFELFAGGEPNGTSQKPPQNIPDWALVLKTAFIVAHGCFSQNHVNHCENIILRTILSIQT